MSYRAPFCIACNAPENVAKDLPVDVVASAMATYAFAFACCYGLAAVFDAMCDGHRAALDDTPTPKHALHLAQGRVPS